MELDDQGEGRIESFLDLRQNPGQAALTQSSHPC
jgi:hypothetical protein